MHQFNVAEAKARLSQLVKNALDAEDVVIAKDNKPLVKLVPVRPTRRRRPGSAKGQVAVSKDFGEPLEAMMKPGECGWPPVNFHACPAREKNRSCPQKVRSHPDR